MGNLSLNVKIVLGVVVTSVAAVVVSVWLQVQSHANTVRSAAEADNTALFSVLSQSAVTDVRNSNRRQLLQSLEAFTGHDNLQTVVVYDSTGRSIAWAENAKSGGSFPASIPTKAPSNDLAQHSGQTTIVSKSIQAGGQTVATVYAVFDISASESAVSKALASGLVLMLVVAGLCVAGGIFVRTLVVRQLNALANDFNQLANSDGDLTRRLEFHGSDQLGDISQGFNAFASHVQNTMKELSHGVDEMEGASRTLVSATGETEEGMKRQQAEIQQAANAVREVASVVAEVARNVSETAGSAEEADSEANNGREVVESAMAQIQSLASDISAASGVIDKLRQETENIGSVLDVIRDIAEQTNLLALNAAIEAARAGEQGRGFAVVADEVRTLASRTQTSTQEIQQMIERLQSGAREAVTMMSKGNEQASESVNQAAEAGKSLAAITSGVSSIKHKTDQIASASEEQGAATREIEANMENIAASAKHAADSSADISSNATRLSSLTASMSTKVRRLRV
jgi:methyl-accepting chemotaxis protein